MTYPNKANGTVFIRSGVIYLLWDGQEISAEAFEVADNIPHNMTVGRIRAIGEQIDALRDELDKEPPYFCNGETLA